MAKRSKAGDAQDKADLEKADAASREKTDTMRIWVGAGIGAGIGSAAIAAALLYANRAKKPAPLPKGPKDPE